MTASRTIRERARITASEARLRAALIELQAKRRAAADALPPYADRSDALVAALAEVDAEIASRAKGLGMTESQAWAEYDRVTKARS